MVRPRRRDRDLGSLAWKRQSGKFQVSKTFYMGKKKRWEVPEE